MVGSIEKSQRPLLLVVLESGDPEATSLRM